MARIHRRTVQKDLHDPDNHDDVITNLEPDIRKCEGKWLSEKALQIAEKRRGVKGKEERKDIPI